MTQNELTLSGIKLNLWVLLLVVPLWLLASGLFVLQVGPQNYWHTLSHVMNGTFFLVLLLGVGVHELLHALAWMILNRKGFRSISFGFNVYSFTPYTHFRQPMKVWKYALGGAMPGVLMGLIPVGLSYFNKSVALNFMGFLFLWAAGGDIISLWMLRKLKPNQLVLDHPEKMGCIVINEEPNSMLH